MIVSASKSVTPFIMPEAVQYVDIVCQPSAVSVDCNNVQANPLKLQAVYRNGKDAEPYEVYWRMQVQQGGKPLGSADSPGASSAWEYCLPTDRWGSADSIVVEAYQDASYRVLLARETVGILRQNPTPFPVEGEWKPLPFKYKNGEYFLDSASGFIFMWMNPVPGNSELHPLEDIKQHPNETCWQHHAQWTILATQVMMAKWAKLGSAVFSGDYMLSQQGVSKGTNPRTGEPYDYTDFTPDMGKFVPNVLFDFMSGYAHFAGKKVWFDGTDARIGWLEVVGDDVVAYEETGGRREERIRITKSNLPSMDDLRVNQALSSRDTAPAGTDISDSVASKEGYREHWYDDVYGEDNRIEMYQEFEVSGSGVVSLDFESMVRSQDYVVNDYNEITLYDATGGMVSKSSTNYLSTRLTGGKYKAKLLATFRGDVWKGTMEIFFRNPSIQTWKRQTVLGLDGLLVTADGNYMRQSTDLFETCIGRYGIRITPHSIQKQVDGRWSNL